jgi:hypothetical protein
MAVALFIMAAIGALESMRSSPATGFDLVQPMLRVLNPHDVATTMQLIGSTVFGAICGLFTAAVFAARHGMTGELESTDGGESR